MTDFIGDVPIAARRVVLFYADALSMITYWDPREVPAMPHQKALDYAEVAHARDGRPRCIAPSIIGYVVYPLKRGTSCAPASPAQCQGAAGGPDVARNAGVAGAGLRGAVGPVPADLRGAHD